MDDLSSSFTTSCYMEMYQSNKETKRILSTIFVKKIFYNDRNFTYQNCIGCIVDTVDGNCGWHRSLYPLDSWFPIIQKILK